MMTIVGLRARAVAARRLGAAVGGCAVVAGIAVSTWANPPTPRVAVDAHEKFRVITVIANPPVSEPVTVTETNKPHQLATPRAVPRVLAPRTVMTQP